MAVPPRFGERRVRTWVIASLPHGRVNPRLGGAWSHEQRRGRGSRGPGWGTGVARSPVEISSSSGTREKRAKALKQARSVLVSAGVDAHARRSLFFICLEDCGRWRLKLSHRSLSRALNSNRGCEMSGRLATGSGRSPASIMVAGSPRCAIFAFSDVRRCGVCCVRRRSKSDSLMMLLARSTAALTAFAVTFAAAPAYAAPRAEASPAPQVEEAAPQVEEAAPLALETPRLRFSDKGAGMDGKKMMSIGILLSAAGAASVIGSSFFVMSCPASLPLSPVSRSPIKCFQGPSTEIDTSKPAGENEVDVSSGAGYYTLPVMVTLAAVGGVMLATGVTMIVLGAKKRKAMGFSAAPSFQRGGGGMVLTGRF